MRGIRFDHDDKCKFDPCDFKHGDDMHGVRFFDKEKCKFDPCDEKHNGDFHRLDFDRDHHDKCKVDFCDNWDSHKISWEDWSRKCKVDFCRDLDWDARKMSWEDWKAHCKIDFCDVRDGSHEIVFTRGHDGRVDFDRHDFDRKHDDGKRHDDDKHKVIDKRHDDKRHDFDRKHDDHKVIHVCIEKKVVVVVHTLVQQILVQPSPQVVLATQPQIVTVQRPQVTTVSQRILSASRPVGVSLFTVPSTGDAGLMGASNSNAGTPASQAAAALLVSMLALGGIGLTRKIRKG
jgi:hypothetical protein